MTAEVNRDHALAALRISAVSVAWTAVTSTSAIALGVATNTAVLVAFGAIGLVDGIGSVALVAHFRHAVRHERYHERLERAAHQIVLVGLFVVGMLSFIQGTARALEGTASESTALTIGFTIAVLAGGGTIAVVKRRIALEVDSPSLLSDSHVSAIGSIQAAIALLGAIATEALGWDAADGIATAMIGAGAVVLSVRTWRAELRQG